MNNELNTKLEILPPNLIYPKIEIQDKLSIGGKLLALGLTKISYEKGTYHVHKLQS